MKRLPLAMLCLLLASCATQQPKVTPKQAAQANVMTTPPTPLQKVAASEEHFTEYPVWLFNKLFPNGCIAEVDLPADVIVKILPFNHAAIVATNKP